MKMPGFLGGFLTHDTTFIESVQICTEEISIFNFSWCFSSNPTPRAAAVSSFLGVVLADIGTNFDFAQTKVL